MLGLAGAGTAGYSRLDKAGSAQGRYDITEAMGELAAFLEAVDAPQIVPHPARTQEGRSTIGHVRLHPQPR